MGCVAVVSIREHEAVVADLVQARADEDARALLVFEDRSWTGREWAAECAAVATFLHSRSRNGPFHIGVLLDNVPEYTFVLGAAALLGATVVGVNPTRRGAELVRDIAHTDCQFLVTERRHQALLDGLDLPVPPDARFVVDDPAWEAALAPCRDPAVQPAWPEVDPRAPFLLVFTSGTTGAPKAVQIGHGRMAVYAANVGLRCELTPDDVCYGPMPLFHSDAIITNWAPSLKAGAAFVLARRFSASGFVADLRRHGVTFANYVGKALTYVLATPETPGEAALPLRLVMGNEAPRSTRPASPSASAAG